MLDYGLQERKLRGATQRDANIAEARRMSVSCADPCHGFQLQPFFRDVNLLFEAKEVYLVCISHFFSVPVVPSLRKF